MKAWAWMAGRIVPLDEAGLALDDPGFLLGDGVFETLRVRRGRVFRWDLHAARLSAGFVVVGIESNVLAVATRAVHELAAHVAECADDVYLRVQVTGDAAGEGAVTALARALPNYARLHRQGARLSLADWQRDPADPLAGVKSLSYLPQVRTRRRARAQGFDDALILNTSGRVCEASYANVFARRGRLIYAPGPQEGALAGVTRQVLLDALKQDGYRLQYRLDREALDNADEVLLVATLAGVVAAVTVEGVGKCYAGVSGELFGCLTALYAALLDAA